MNVTVKRCRVCDGYEHKGGPWIEAATAHERCLPVKCPQCSGKGQVVTSTRTERECCHGGSPSFAGCEYCPNMRVRTVPEAYAKCPLCLGVGRLEREPTPITEIKGWRL